MTLPTPTAEPQASSPVAPLLRRHAVRPKQGVTLTAIPVVRPEVVTLPDGTVFTAKPGEWLIAKGNQIVDVVSQTQLANQYEATDKDGLLIRAAARTRIEQVLGHGSTETPEHLITAVERLAKLRIGKIDVPFTPQQWDQIAHRAGKMGITSEALVRRLLDRFTQDLWTI